MIMSSVKITVIKRFSPEEVFNEQMTFPDGRIIPRCPVFEDGQEIIIESIFGSKPDEFCGWGWHDLFKDLSVIACGGNFEHIGTNVMYTSCRDGLRPVVFKLERT
jgi:uncharacterized repeat protein (TIGR04076 family)